MAAPSATALGPTLWFVGDGETHYNSDPDTDWTPEPEVDGLESDTGPLPAEATFSMATGELEDAETVFFQHGGWNADSFMNPFIPSFVFAPEAGPVVLSGKPVTAYFYADDRNALDCGAIEGQLFDLEGNMLGEADTAVDSTAEYGTVEEYVFKYQGIAGEFSGLVFQGAGRWADCNASGVEIFWGGGAYPGRLQLADGDYIGSPETSDPSGEGEGPGSEGGEESGPETIEEGLTTDSVGIDHQFSGTNDTYIYTWNGSFSDVEVATAVQVDAGSVDVTVADGNGTEILSSNLTATFNDTQVFEGVATGEWTITIAYTDFSGRLALDITEYTAASPGEGDDGTSEAAETGSSDGSNGIPGFGIVALVATLGAVLALMRRRS